MLAYLDSQRFCCKQHKKNEPKQHWFPSLPFQQFMRLFNSLFKVLFIFPSRYFFAIGLLPLFSFRWNLPPDWSCIPKQLDSAKAPRGATGTRPTGLSPSLVPHSRGLGPGPPQGQRSKDYNSEAEGSGFSSWALPGSLAVTRGILVSFFSSA